MEHSVLGTRWVYDGLRDPLLVVMLAAVAMTGQGEALGMAVYDGRWYIAPTTSASGGGWSLERVPVEGFELESDEAGRIGAAQRPLRPHRVTGVPARTPPAIGLTASCGPSDRSGRAGRGARANGLTSGNRGRRPSIGHGPASRNGSGADGERRRPSTLADGFVRDEAQGRTHLPGGHPPGRRVRAARPAGPRPRPVRRGSVRRTRRPIRIAAGIIAVCVLIGVVALIIAT